MSLASAAMAQEVETVVVTGSRIPQVGVYSSSPVTAVTNQEIKYEGTTNVETLLNNLPSAFADFGSYESNGSPGTATVNLRNLGSARTLVLIDGKRLMPGDPSLPSPDLNQVPAALVDHVEVVTGGASAVYGSDAIAGVVNFVMRKDFEGVEFDGQWTGYQHTNDNAFARGFVAQGLGGTTPGPAQQIQFTRLGLVPTTAPVLGVINSVSGSLGLAGVTSGRVTITVKPAAGTWTWTLPTTPGLSLYFPARSQQQPKLRAFIDIARRVLRKPAAGSR